jgi:hypothetical protein
MLLEPYICIACDCTPRMEEVEKCKKRNYYGISWVEF